MSVPYPYTDEARIVTLAGQMAIDLRLDDSVDAAADLDSAIDIGTIDTDIYLTPRYAQNLAAQDEWVAQNATFFAVRFLCLRRLNEMTEGLRKECERREKILMLVKQGKFALRIANSRRAVVVTGYNVVLRDYNNQVKVDRSRSTGIAKGYLRPTDNTAPDNR